MSEQGEIDGIRSALAAVKARLDRIEAVEAIGKLVAIYARGADLKNDAAIMGRLHHEHAVWEANGFGRFEGRDAILAAVGGIARDKILWCVHYMVAPLIDINPDGRTAKCSWYLWELAKIRGDDGVVRDSWIAGYYDSSLSLADTGWGFEHVRLDVRLISPVGVPWDPAAAGAAPDDFFRSRSVLAIPG